MDLLLETLRQEWQSLVQLAPRALAALVLFLLVTFVGRAVGRGLEVVLRRGQLTSTHLLFFRRLSVWLFGLLGLAIALNVVGLGGVATGLLAGGGITAVVLGFAFREIGENLLAGFFLAFSRPFEVKDLILSGDYRGTVRSIQLRYTHIRTADGRDIFIPNAQIFNRPLVNFTRDGLLRPSFTVGIDYRDDARAACRLLLATVAAVDGVLEEPPPTVSITGLAPAWVELEVVFWIDTFDQQVSLPQVRTEVMDGCRTALREAGLTLSSDVTSAIDLHPRTLAVGLVAGPGDPAAGDPAAAIREPQAHSEKDIEHGLD